MTDNTGNNTTLNIQWYPGHMAKATRLIKEDIKNVDVIIKLLDARAVLKSENKDFNKIFSSKKTINVYNKMDLADENITKKWITYFKENDITSFFVDSISKKNLNLILNYLNSFKENFRTNRETRAMVVGIPNVGKSQFINSLTKKSNARTGNKPGVTMSKQWIKVKGEVYLLDTPGILPPKFENIDDAIALASIGSVKDTILDREELALELIKFLMKNYPKKLQERYKLNNIDEYEQAIDVYEDIGKNRGFLLKGGDIDYLRTAVTVLDEFKNGEIGRVSFDSPR